MTMSKTKLDQTVERILYLKQLEKETVAEIKTLEATLQVEFQLGQDPTKKEINEKFEGKKTFFEKVAVENGKNNYDVETLRGILSVIRGAVKKVIKKEVIYSVDTKALTELVKTGKVTLEQIKPAKQSSWYFKFKYGRIENEEQTIPAATRRAAR